MALTRKDFEDLAEIVETLDQGNHLNGSWGRYNLADALSTFCAARNPRFDRERFMRLCGEEP